MRAYFTFYVAALLLSVVLTSFAAWLGKRLGLTDMPGVRKVHAEPIPCVGGSAIYFSVVLVVLPLVFSFHAAGHLSPGIHAKMSALALAATVVFLLGLADDIRGLRARLKLLVQLAMASLLCFGGIRIEAIAVGQWSPVPLGWFAWPVTVLWIVGITNAVNLSDGVDGLAATVSMIACGVVAALAMMSGQTELAVLMVAMLGALTGFLGFNFYPARIFLGDSGSLFLGFTIAAGSVLCFMQSRALAVLALPAVALGIPILDTLVTMLRRFIARWPIFAPDRGHFHHRLLQLGLGQRQVVAVVCAATLLVTGLGVLALRAEAGTSLVLFGIIGGLLVTLFCAVGAVRLRTVVAGLRSRFRLRRQQREEIGRFCNLQLQFDQVTSPGAWWQALCSTAGRLDFAWMSVDITDVGGHVETYLWRCPETPSPGARVTVVKVPVRVMAPGAAVEVEVAVLTDGSVEGAVRRASLLGRLIDEYRMPTSRGTARGLGAAMDEGPAVGVKRSLPTQLPTAVRPRSTRNLSRSLQGIRTKLQSNDNQWSRPRPW